MPQSDGFSNADFRAKHSLLADFWDLFNFGRLFGDLAWICVGFPTNPELRLVLAQV